MIIEQAKDVLKIEAQGILDLVDRVGPEFEKAVQIIVKARGRVIITGMGKSGLVGRKISATLSSTGTPSIFMHPAEALHGDLGMVTRDDVVLAISNGGHTHEINKILPMIKKEMGAKIISFTGNLESPMARMSDVVIDVKVEREACPITMAPTTSTTAAVAMGDAMAVVLMKMRRFGQKDFKRFHPGGTLGERLGTKVREVMFTGDNVPVVNAGTTVYDAIVEIDS
jgi:arabinose-5-phosphate isomerase